MSLAIGTTLAATAPIPHFVGSLQFWYTVADSDQGDIKVRAVLNFQH